MSNDELNYDLLQEMPLDFIELAFGDILWSKEKEIVESVKNNKYTTVRSAHGTGKSFTSSRIVLWFLHSFPNSKVITTAPTFRQVSEVLWREIRSARNKSRINLGGKANLTSINLDDQWFAMGLSTDDPDRFQGFHATDILLVIDEASGVAEDIFNASEGIVSSKNAHILYIGNPTNIEGTFYHSFKMAGYGKIHISAFDTPNFTEFNITLEDIKNNTWKEKITHDLPASYLITPEWVYDKFLRWGEGNPMWESRVMGNFPEQGEDTLIPLIKIEEAMRRHLDYLPTDKERIGMDVSRFGSDFTELCYVKGPKVLDWKTYNHMDTMETAQKLQIMATTYINAEIGIDEIGVGAGVYDRAKQKMSSRDIYGVNVGEQPFDKETFLNLRAEIFWALRERFIEGRIDLSSLSETTLEDLSAQLSQIKFKFTTKGQIQIESKADMKKRGLPSPDKADALAIAFGRLKGIVSWLPVFDKPTVDPRENYPLVNPQPPATNFKDDDARKKAELAADLAAIAEQNRARGFY